MSQKVHWRLRSAYGHTYCGFRATSKRPRTWRSLCGRFERTKLGEGLPRNKVHPWLVCGMCENEELKAKEHGQNKK